jgi:hypothetical protein
MGTNFKILQDLKTKKITKFIEIEKIIKCPCGKGKMKLKMIHVNPENGRIALSYDKCSEPFCSYERGAFKLTEIIIPELILGE